MKKKNGFTLIELLAIIVILAIIAVITVPIVLDIVDISNKASVKNSAYGYKKSIDNFYYAMSVNNPDYQFENKRYNSDELKNLGISVSGKEPGITSWVDIIHNSIIDGCLQFGDYIVQVGYNYVSDASKGQCDSVNEWNQTVFPTVLKIVDGTTYYDTQWIKANPIYFNPSDNSKCNLTSSSSEFGVSSGCMKWYAYSESNGKVNLLLDHNLTNNGAWGDTNQSEPTDLLSVLVDKTDSWSDKLVRNDSYSVSWSYGDNDYSLFIDYSGNKARFISAEEIANITDNSSWSRSGSSYYFGSMSFGDSDGYPYQDADEQLRQESVSWLFDNTNQCNYFGCDVSQDDVWAYWTISPNTGTEGRVWCISYNGSLDSADSYVNYIGLRPVISVSKSTIY